MWELIFLLIHFVQTPENTPTASMEIRIFVDEKQLSLPGLMRMTLGLNHVYRYY